MVLAIALIALAFLLVMLEMAFPSFGLLSLGAATAYAFALTFAFQEGSNAGWSAIGLGVVLLPIAIALGLKWLPNSPFGKRVVLQGPAPENVQQGTLPTERLTPLIGCDGTALTDLRPAGSARIEGRRIDVVTDGRFVSKGARIRVLQAGGNRVLVRAITEASAPAGAVPPGPPPEASPS